MVVNIGLRDTVYILEALQIVPLLVVLVWAGHFVIKQKPFTQQLKLGLLILLAINVIAATVIYCLGTFNYLHYDRPLYKQENAYAASHP